MNIQPDFKELLRLFVNHEVEYMIVGGYAVAFHGHARFTQDIDVFYRATNQNISNLRRALCEFGFDEAQLPKEPFTRQGDIVRFGVPPSRVDLLNQIDGVEFDQAFSNSVLGNYDGVPMRFIGREDLLRNKRATSRTKDKADAEELE